MGPLPDFGFVRYGGATSRQRVEAAYYIFHTWRADNENVNRIFNVTQTVAFLDHETDATFLMTDTSPEQRFVGIVSIMVQEPEGFLRNKVAPEYWVCNLFVHERNRKQGCGSRLLERAESHLRENGVPSVNLWCEQHLQAFYEGRGWKKKGDFEAKPGTVHMTKILTSLSTHA